jgi:ArsR family transcriptional regulator
VAQHTLKGSGRGQAAISHQELRARLFDQRLVTIDVMPEERYADGHIPGSINLPVAQIETKARQAIPSLSQEIAVYCAGPA